MYLDYLTIQSYPHIDFNNYESSAKSKEEKLIAGSKDYRCWQLGLSLINIWLHCLILVGLLQKLSCGKDTCNLEQGEKTI